MQFWSHCKTYYFIYENGIWHPLKGHGEKPLSPLHCLFPSKWPLKLLLSYTELQQKEAEVQYKEKNNQKTQQWEREMLSIQSLTFVPDTWALAAEDIISLQDELGFC